MPSAASIVPAFDVAVHIVLDDFGKDDRVYLETDEADVTFETVIEDLLTGQYNSPLRVVASTRLRVGPVTCLRMWPAK